MHAAGEEVPPEWLRRPSLSQGGEWARDIYLELRRSVSGDHPVGVRDVSAWLDLQGFDDPGIRRLVWNVVRRVDSQQMAWWAEDRAERRDAKGGR